MHTWRSFFRHRIVRPFVVVVLSLFAMSCASRKCPVCDDTPSTSARNSGSSYFCGDDFDDPDEMNLSKTISAQGSVDILILSGGGSRGSFGAGILAGWEAKPEFDMVTGVSTGAIMATWAYLGPDHRSKPYEKMEQTYAGHITAKQIRSRRWMFPFVDSKYSLAPLKERFRTILPTEMILDVGREYRDTGRQLWIGSTNLETGQFCHWNLSERALNALEADEANNKQRVDDIVENYYDLIIASSANPTVFQSVEIDGYTHVDGGVSETLFVERLNHIATDVKALRADGTDKPLNVYAIVNGRLVTSQQCVDHNVVALATRSIGLLSKSATRANLDRISVTVSEGLGSDDWNYHTGWIEANRKLDSSDEFTKKGMAELFAHGKSWVNEGANGKGRWCPDIPRITHPNEYCRLPVSGRKSCSK